MSTKKDEVWLNMVRHTANYSYSHAFRNGIKSGEVQLLKVPNTDLTDSTCWQYRLNYNQMNHWMRFPPSRRNPAVQLG